MSSVANVGTTKFLLDRDLPEPASGPDLTVT